LLATVEQALPTNVVSIHGACGGRRVEAGGGHVGLEPEVVFELRFGAFADAADLWKGRGGERVGEM
jgi:hypothetical protein